MSVRVAAVEVDGARNRTRAGDFIMSLERTNAPFRTTQWTLISALSGADEKARGAAMEALAERYWPPVYAALRRMGKGREEAAEITQAFFAEVVLQRALFDRAAPERGRLRSLVLAALKRFLIDRARRRAARGGGRMVALEALEREEAMVAASGGLEMEQVFERRWALATFEEALRRCERHFISNGRAGHWSVFEARIVRPALGGVEARALREVSAEAGFRTPADAAAAVQVVKARLLALVLEVAAETVEDAAEAERESEEVLGLLR